jgi:RNA polymerase sigma factor (TIGR02999 family)
MSSHQSITAVLLAYQKGTPGALDELFELVYPQLRLIARRQLSRGRPDGPVLDTTGLVHEAYFKLVDPTQVGWRDRNHFFAIAARAMRQVIVDCARERSRLKRGAGRPHLDLDERQIAIDAHVEQLLAVNEALERLEAEEPRLLRIVECRYFAGYTEEETAEALAISTRTVERDWLRAKAWLRRVMLGPPEDRLRSHTPDP